MHTLDIAWSEDYATGIDIIDEQHKKLFEYFAQVDSMTHTGSEDDIRYIVKQLLDYAISHNSFEEGLMEEAGYPMAASHKKIHDAFKERALSYEQKINNESNPKKLAREIRIDIGLWLINHIKREDRHYVNDVKAYLKKASRKRKPLFGLLG